MRAPAALAGAVLAAAVLAGGFLPVGPSAPRAVLAAASDGDCDGDGDAGAASETSHEEYLECSNAPPEPGKTLPPSEKAKAAEQSISLNAKFASACGNRPSDPLFWITTYAGLLSPCNLMPIWIHHVNALANDPPDPQVREVAMPAVPRVGKAHGHCRQPAASCRQGGKIAAAYVGAFAQTTAAADALVTSLNRLATTPAKPENIVVPLYTRRTQAAASRLYSGLLAAWSDRLTVARGAAVQLLKGLGGQARGSAEKLPEALPSGPLWQSYHQLTIYEIAQLTDDLYTQQLLTVAAKRGQAIGLAAIPTAQALLASKKTLVVDLNGIYAAKGGAPQTAAVRKLVHDEQAMGAIPGLGKLVPDGRFVSGLLAFAAEALLPGTPAPPRIP